MTSCPSISLCASIKFGMAAPISSDDIGDILESGALLGFQIEN